MLKDDEGNSKVGHSCLLLEISILSGIGSHPNLVSFYGACVEDMDTPIIVQELIEGPNLHDYLKAKPYEFNLGAPKVVHIKFQVPPAYSKRDYELGAHVCNPTFGFLSLKDRC